MKNVFENNVMTFYFDERIDTNNAKDLQEAALNVLLDYEKDTEVVLDFDKVEYISSSGLRMVLSIKQKYPNTIIINTCLDVYNVFEMTGFSTMMKVMKKYREVSIKGCKKIGEGAVGEIYQLTPDEIVKVFKYEMKMSDIEREISVTKKAFVLGLPTTIAFDIVKADGKFGLVFELMKSKTICEQIIADPDHLEKYIDMIASLFNRVHSTIVPEGSFPKDDVMIFRKLDYAKVHLTDEEYNKIKTMVSNIKVKNRLVHGDFHIKNIMTQDGEPVLIDLDDVSIGNPLTDYAAAYGSYIIYSETDPNNAMDFFGIPAETLRKINFGVIQRNFKDAKNLDEIIEKIDLLAAIIVLYNEVKYEEDKNQVRIDCCMKHIRTLLPKYDNLDIL